jgi:hypothetical protein
MAQSPPPAAIIILVDLFDRLTEFFNAVTPSATPKIIQSHATRITIFNLHHQIQMQLE